MRCDERDAEAFGLGARRAVVGLLALQVALDEARVERAEDHAAGHQRGIRRLPLRGVAEARPRYGSPRLCRESSRSCRTAFSWLPGLP